MNILTRRCLKAARLFFVIAAVGFLSYGCTAMKALTGTMTELDDEKISQIEKGVTTKDTVLDLMGKPYTNENNEFSYIYLNIYADNGGRLLQEYHVFFDDEDVVNKITYVDGFKGPFENADPKSIYEMISSYEIGKTTLDEPREARYPSIFLQTYHDGSLTEQLIRYYADRPVNESIKGLPFIHTEVTDSGNVLYSMGFTAEDLLKAADDITSIKDTKEPTAEN